MLSRKNSTTRTWGGEKMTKIKSKLVGCKVKVKKKVQFRHEGVGKVMCEVHGEGTIDFIVQFQDDWCYYAKNELTLVKPSNKGEKKCVSA